MGSESTPKEDGLGRHARFDAEGLRRYRILRGWDPPPPSWSVTLKEALATATDPVERRGLELATRRRQEAVGHRHRFPQSALDAEVYDPIAWKCDDPTCGEWIYEGDV